MIDKTRFLGISALKLAGKIEEMNDEQLQEYDQLLVAFIENFPGEEEKIKVSLTENLNEGVKYKELENNLYAMSKTLGRLHADDLSKECHKQIEELKGADREKIEAFVTNFLSAAAMLSIDIQMAKYIKPEKQAELKAGAAADAEAKLVDKTTVISGGNTEKTILAVDDAMISLNMLKKNFQGSPYKLICVNSGKDALLYLKRHKPDLFILDIEMPKMDGYELAEKIKELGQEAPIIFLTGNATKRNVMRAMEAGASDFIVKPINKEYFVYKIQKYL